MWIRLVALSLLAVVPGCEMDQQIMGMPSWVVLAAIAFLVMGGDISKIIEIISKIKKQPVPEIELTSSHDRIKTAMEIADVFESQGDEATAKKIRQGLHLLRG